MVKMRHIQSLFRCEEGTADVLESKYKTFINCWIIANVLLRQVAKLGPPKNMGYQFKLLKIL